MNEKIKYALLGLAVVAAVAVMALSIGKSSGGTKDESFVPKMIPPPDTAPVDAKPTPAEGTAEAAEAPVR